MKAKSWLLTTVVAGCVLAVAAPAQLSADAFYKGKTIRTARPMLEAKGDERLIPYLIHRRWEQPEVKNLPLIPDVLKKDTDKLTAYKT